MIVLKWAASLFSGHKKWRMYKAFDLEVLFPCTIFLWQHGFDVSINERTLAGSSCTQSLHES